VMMAASMSGARVFERTISINGVSKGLTRAAVSEGSASKKARPLSTGRVKSRGTCGCFALFATDRDDTSWLCDAQWSWA
jgi:hypothetical protein